MCFPKIAPSFVALLNGKLMVLWHEMSRSFWVMSASYMGTVTRVPFVCSPYSTCQLKSEESAKMNGAGRNLVNCSPKKKNNSYLWNNVVNIAVKCSINHLPPPLYFTNLYYFVDCSLQRTHTRTDDLLLCEAAETSVVPPPSPNLAAFHPIHLWGKLSMKIGLFPHACIIIITNPVGRNIAFVPYKEEHWIGKLPAEHAFPTEMGRRKLR